MSERGHSGHGQPHCSRWCGHRADQCHWRSVSKRPRAAIWRRGIQLGPKSTGNLAGGLLLRIHSHSGIHHEWFGISTVPPCSLNLPQHLSNVPTCFFSRGLTSQRSKFKRVKFPPGVSPKRRRHMSHISHMSTDSDFLSVACDKKSVRYNTTQTIAITAYSVDLFCSIRHYKLQFVIMKIWGFLAHYMLLNNMRYI